MFSSNQILLLKSDKAKYEYLGIHYIIYILGL